MSEEKKEAFLQRWSRMKREEKLPVPEETPKPALPEIGRASCRERVYHPV